MTANMKQSKSNQKQSNMPKNMPNITLTSPFDNKKDFTPENFDVFLKHMISYNPKTGKRDNIRQS
jgi:hypothetical protein